jgi:hypothetical protein
MAKLIAQRVLALNHHVDHAVVDQCQGIGVHPYDHEGKFLQRSFLGSQVFATFMGILKREGWESAVMWLEELLGNIGAVANEVGQNNLTKKRRIKITITKVDG